MRHYKPQKQQIITSKLYMQMFSVTSTLTGHTYYVKVKLSPYKVYITPEACSRLRPPGFSENWHTKVARLSALGIGRLYPQGTDLC